MATTSKQSSAAPKLKAKQTKKPTSVASNNTSYYGLGLILLLTFIVYYPSLDNGFTNWDDDTYVTENNLIHNFRNTSQMIKTPVAGNYHPLTMYSLAMDWQLSSKKLTNMNNAQQENERAKTFHRTNLILHLFNTALVFLFIWQLSGKRKWVSWVVALFFGIHPMHVESVAWIAERKDVLYSFFFLISLLAYLWYREKKNINGLIVCFISFIFSLASKPAAVVLPLVLLMIDYFQSRKWDQKTLLEKVPFFILSIILGLLTIKSQAGSAALDEVGPYNLIEKFLFACYGAMMYVIKFFLPFGLSHFYPYPKTNDIGLIYYLSPLFIILALGAVYYFARKQKVVVFGLAFFFINIVLVLQFLTVGKAVMADRYTYLPYIGFLFILGWWLDEPNRIIASTKMQLRPILLGGLGVLAVICCVQTYIRCEVWKDSETLWTDAINKNPQGLMMGYNNRGHAFRRKANQAFQSNNAALGNQYHQNALSDFNRAIQLEPNYALAWANKGNIFLDQNKNDSAIYYYDRAIAMDSSLWQALINRGGAKAKLNNLQGSIDDLTLALKKDGNNEIALENRAISYALKKDHVNSIADYRRLFELKPNDDNILNSIGVGYQELGQHRESIIEFTKAISMAPNNAMYYSNRSFSWRALGENTKATLDEQKAASLQRGLPRK